MADDRQQEVLRRYIERVTALQAERGRRLELDDMKDIARELGMSEEDIAAADSAARTHLDRGLRHSYYGRWSDAINELREAASLDPTSIEGLHGLAIAHKERWLASHDIEDRRQAAELARRTLALDPLHDPSYVLLNELDRPQAHLEAAPPRRSHERRPLVGWIIGGVALVLIIIFTLRALAPRPHHPDPEIATQPAPSTMEPSVMTPADRPPEAALDNSAGGAIAGELPVTWEGMKEDGVDLRFRVSRDAGADLMIVNVGTRAITALTFHLLGEDGSPGPAITPLNGPLQPGASTVVGGALGASPRLKAVVTSISAR